MGSPPPTGLKNDVPANKSKDNKTKAPAKTGVDNRAKAEVANIAQQNKGILCISISGIRILKMVVAKLIAPKIDDVPTNKILKIQISCPHLPVNKLRGG